MADWDVVSTKPDPWAVVNHQPAPRLPTPGDLGQAFSLLARSLPAGAISGVTDLLSRITGQGPHPGVGNFLLPQTNLPAAPPSDRPVPSLQDIGSAAVRGIENVAGPTAADVVRQAGGVAQDVGQIAPALGAARAATGGLNALSDIGQAATEAPPPGPGFIIPGEHPIAAAIAGPSGKQALNIHAQNVADQVAAAEARVPQGTPLTPQAVQDARAPMHEVFNRFAGALPNDMALPDNLQTSIAALDKAEPQLANIPGHVSINGQFGGQTLVDKWRQLRQEGSGQMAAEGDNAVTQQQIGKAKMDLADKLLKFGSDQLPEGAPVTQQQLQDANTAYAKSYAVEDAMRGGNSVDMARLGRASAAQSGLFTGGLKNIADFANQNPSIAGLGTRIYAPPSYAGDVAGAGREALSILSPNFYANLLGTKVGARGLLTSGGANTADFVSALRAGQPNLNEIPMTRLTAPPGNARPVLTTQTGMALPQGPGPNPDLRLAPPPGNARPQLTTQTDLVNPQGPGGVNKNLPQNPPGANQLPAPSLFDEIQAPGLQVHRGVQPGTNPTVPQNRAGALFYTPSAEEAAGYGPLVHTASPTDIHDAGSITDLIKNNGGNPARAGQQDELMKALAAYRNQPGAKEWLKFSYPIEGNPAEYVHFPPSGTAPTPAVPLGNQMVGP